MKVNWDGVYPAVTTKFNADGSIDFAAFDKNLEAQIQAGVDAIVIAGSLGEASALSGPDKQAILQSAIKLSAGRVPVLLNIAEKQAHEAIRIAQEAEANGASGLMLLPPMQYKADDRECIAFFRSVAQSTKLPIMLYNNPVDYKISISISMLEALADCENIQAVKESSRDITNVTRMRNAFGDRYKILCGVDTLALECIAAGADGWVAGLVNAFPRETVVIYKLVKAGRLAEALAIYRWFMPLLELDIHPKLVQYIKLAEVATGLGTEMVRAPRLVLEGEERSRILDIINKGVSARPDMSSFASL